MLFKDINIIDENFRFKAHQYVATEGDKIAYIGEGMPADPDRYGEVYEGDGKLLMSALYNAHAHAPMVLLRGYAENLPLQAWLSEKCWPFEDKITPEDNYWGMLLACAELVRYGGVSFSDMYFATDKRAEAVIDSGLKANLCEGFIAREDKSFYDMPLYEAYEEFVRKLHGAANGRILIDYNLHAEYTTFPQACSDVIRVAAEKGLRLQVHVSETRSEVQECRERHNGLSPVAYFASLGLFEVPTTAAHCVWVDDDDIAILRDYDVFVAYNPASNMKLGSGFAPIPKLLDAGVSVCLGTDGMASNNNHNMFQDMYLMGLLSKGSTLDPAVITPEQVLAAATRNGALSQGREDCGLLREGMKADLCVVDISGPSWTPMTDPLYNLLYAGDGSDVVMTLSDGIVVYRDGSWPTIDIERAQAEVSARTARILTELSES